jgi:hypothetical protein
VGMDHLLSKEKGEWKNHSKISAHHIQF